ncbi:hypothetical protein JHK84_034671 [Glycine max]|nr:hypothetical protein JHK84_034671 [Glycine max]
MNKIFIYVYILSVFSTGRASELQSKQNTGMFLGPIRHEINIPHFLKRVPRQQAIRPGLVAFPNGPVHV